jgi:hypothetical protein
LGSSEQHPKVFLLPILLKADLPFPKTIKWDLLLLSFKFKVREWKLFVKACQGSSWLALIWSRAIESGGLEDQPSTMEIPSPRIGKGGYSSEDFLAKSPSNRSLKSERICPSGGSISRIRSRFGVEVRSFSWNQSVRNDRVLGESSMHFREASRRLSTGREWDWHAPDAC